MNVLDFAKAKNNGRKIAMITCYDYWSAKIIAETDIDVILVGDTLSMIMHGHDTTLPATMDHMVLHTEAVVRGAPNKFIVGDMPFLSFRKGLKEGMENIHRLMTTGAQAIKLEGIRGNEELVHHASESGVPMIVHLGMTPQSTNALGGFRVQSRCDESAQQLLDDAQAAVEAGAFCLVLECVPSHVAAQVSELVPVPTIGIGAGPHVDGQVLVLQDMLGANAGFAPKFLRTYGNIGENIKDAVNAYAQDVAKQNFPAMEESYA